MESEVGEDGLCGRSLVVDVIAGVDDTQCRQTGAQSRRSAPCHHRRRDAGALQHLQSMSIERVEALEQFALRAKVQTAIGQHPVHIEQ